MNEARSIARTAIAYVFLALAVTAALVALAANADAAAAAWRSVSVRAIALSLAAALLANVCTMLSWRSLLAGAGQSVEVRDASRLWFTSQLGKYLPGTVWPIAAQMEFGRRRGIPRGVMLASNLLAIVVGLTSGLALSLLLGPWIDQSLLARYWWAWIALPALMVFAHPRLLPAVLNRALGMIGRTPTVPVLTWASTISAWFWSVLAWLFLGAHVAALTASVGPGIAVVFLVSLVAVTLATSAGILAIPVPAGVGIREGILVAVLAPSLGTTPALVVAVVSRLLMVAADLLAAGLSTVAHFATRAGPES